MLKRITGTLWVAGLYFLIVGIATKKTALILVSILPIALAVFLKWLYTDDRKDGKEKNTENQSGNKQVEPVIEAEPKAHADSRCAQTPPAEDSAPRHIPENAYYTLDAVIKRYSVRCDYTVEQQKEWLTVLSKTIPTIMLGENPLCVDYYLMPRQREEAGNMLNTVGRIALQVGQVLSITNLEKTLNTVSIINVIRTYCILNEYAGMLKEPYGNAINASKAYIYSCLEKVDLTRLKPLQDLDKKLFWVPVMYKGDPLNLDAPDYEIHVFPAAAEMMNNGTKAPADGEIPSQYSFAKNDSGKDIHLRTIIHEKSNARLVPLFTDFQLMLKIFSPNIRVGIVDYKTACSICLKSRQNCAGISINPGRDNKLKRIEQIEKETGAVQTTTQAKPAISKEKCMISQFAALFVHTGDNAYRDDYINKLRAIGFEQEEAEKLFLFECKVIRVHGKTYLRDPEFVHGWFFNLKEPVFRTYPQKKEDLLKEKAFVVSELCKLIDEAEWHYWNSHEKAVPEKVWEEIFDWRIKGAGAEFAIGYFEMIAEETGISLDKLAAVSRENGKHLVRYKWS